MAIDEVQVIFKSVRRIYSQCIEAKMRGRAKTRLFEAIIILLGLLACSAVLAFLAYPILPALNTAGNAAPGCVCSEDSAPHPDSSAPRPDSSAPQGFSKSNVTSWRAPIVWDGTFDPELLDAEYESAGAPAVAVTVFAVGKYTRFLQDFLETAERHFFTRGASSVTYYVFTDRPDDVPDVRMGAGRELAVRLVPGMDRWQDISAGRMGYIQDLIETELRGGGGGSPADYIFCLDVDMKFHDRWGTETLGQLVAQLHPWFYDKERTLLTYDRNPASEAYMAPHEGDYYYAGAVFGGELQHVHRLLSTCRHALELDTRRGVEAAWQEESHLNRYLWLNKPSKVLSPEHLWCTLRPQQPEIRTVRLATVVKNYTEVRPNV